MTTNDFFETFNLQTILNEIERSLVGYQFPKDFQLTEELAQQDLNDEDYQKYFVPEYELLGLAILQLFKSGKGFYIMSYVHDYGINRYVTGFKTKEELVHYANYVLEKGMNALSQLEQKVYQLKAIEDQMSQKEILKKNIEYLETQRKILELIFDMEAKAPYCEKLKTLETVQTAFNSLLETYQLMYPIYQELVRLDELAINES